ncbi:hypothetical protein A2803_01950 [Candidatus Woesebacteria bacterium RIFCSPHIGHO2_01_FULL_44_21]|uniref:Transcobalamin-like C-terminal domain-containing protein n=1 Tax=Candidatus Woesebacteria bacterium RIFCSPHIGHO2_01_FULL_44_21 TaxID=1802503 RepID=A0A1F7YYG7_9BACT|nr:MAG: hypothetical protein A2803_01950 [Candidatus Woesebacteria bacterium RIFCSPHIGHO2_01_FULL_44_21]
MTIKKLEIFVIVVIISVIGIIYAFTQKPVRTPTNDLVRSQSEANIIEYPGQDGQTALELLQARHQVEAKNYSFGDLVMSIDGVTPDSQHFWAMYVNGQFSQVGASAYVTKNSDMIKWQIDEIKN